MLQAENAFVAATDLRAELPSSFNDIPDCPVLVVRDDNKNDRILTAICSFLDIGVAFVKSDVDIGPLLSSVYPIAVITDLEGGDQDGFHIMKTVAHHARRLPILLLTKNEAPLHGAVDAVKEIWRLSHVTTVEDLSQIADVIDFLCRAARGAGRMSTMQIRYEVR